MKSSVSLVPAGRVEQVILLVREQKVILGEDLARLYGVETRALVQAVKRNRERFPADFMFRLTSSESNRLARIHGAGMTWGGRRHNPLAFTEHGVAMLSAVLRSPRAVHVSLHIVRTFVRLRAFLASHESLSRKLDSLSRSTDARFQQVFSAMHSLLHPAEPKREPIGFRSRKRGAPAPSPAPQVDSRPQFPTMGGHDFADSGPRVHRRRPRRRGARDSILRTGPAA